MANNSLTTYRIPALYSFLCANFEANRYCAFVLWQFCNCAKRQFKRKKHEETKPVLKSHILVMLEASLLKFGLWSLDVSRRVHSKNGSAL